MIWTAEDIRNILQALLESNRDLYGLAEGGPLAKMFMAGYESAVTSVAQAFGVDLRGVLAVNNEVVVYDPQGARTNLIEFHVIGEEGR